MLPESFEKARRLAEKRLETYRKIFQTDAKVVFGSDSATIPHGDNAKQFAVYVDLGMTPIQAIRNATIVVADSLGTIGKAGAVDNGFYADIIAVKGQPIGRH
jgi:imidazolonepropionase-like amidohydrolase